MVHINKIWVIFFVIAPTNNFSLSLLNSYPINLIPFAILVLGSDGTREVKAIEHYILLVWYLGNVALAESVTAPALQPVLGTHCAGVQVAGGYCFECELGQFARREVRLEVSVTSPALDGFVLIQLVVRVEDGARAPQTQTAIVVIYRGEVGLGRLESVRQFEDGVWRWVCWLWFISINELRLLLRIKLLDCKF